MRTRRSAASGAQLGHALVCLLTCTACGPTEFDGLADDKGAQSIGVLHVKSVLTPGAEVYELDQRRGMTFNTGLQIPHGTQLVTLKWGSWDIIRTDPLRMVHATKLSATQASCALSTYSVQRFAPGPKLSLHGQRLVAHASGLDARPVIMGPDFSIAVSDTDLSVKSTHTIIPRQSPKAGPWQDTAWMPREAKRWWEDLHVPADELASLVDDNAFLDFASCYMQHQPALVPPLNYIEALRTIALPNGQHAMLNSRLSGRTDQDAQMYEIDRDVLHFGIVAAARRIPSLRPDNTLVLSKRYYGLDFSSQPRVWKYLEGTQIEVVDFAKQIAERIAQTEAAWKLAIFELLFNEGDRRDLSNQMITGSGQVVLFDHEFTKPFLTAVPCSLDLDEWLEDSPSKLAAKDLYTNKKYEEFAAFIAQLIPFRILLDEHGTAFDLTRHYGHLLEQELPPSIRQALHWTLKHRADTDVVERFFREWALLRGALDPETTAQQGVCLFSARINWVYENMRLPSEGEGIEIMSQCNMQPEVTCEPNFD